MKIYMNDDDARLTRSTQRMIKGNIDGVAFVDTLGACDVFVSDWNLADGTAEDELLDAKARNIKTVIFSSEVDAATAVYPAAQSVEKPDFERLIEVLKAMK